MEKKDIANKAGIKNPFANFGLGKYRDYFIENLSMLVAAGMPVISALDSITNEIRSKRMVDILHSIRDDIENGYSIWRALEKSHLFKNHAISLIRLGEESGRLVENLKL